MISERLLRRDAAVERQVHVVRQFGYLAAGNENRYIAPEADV